MLINLDDEEFVLIRHALMQEFNHNGVIPLGTKTILKKKLKIGNGVNF